MSSAKCWQVANKAFYTYLIEDERSDQPDCPHNECDGEKALANARIGEGSTRETENRHQCFGLAASSRLSFECSIVQTFDRMVVYTVAEVSRGGNPDTKGKYLSPNLVINPSNDPTRLE